VKELVKVNKEMLIAALVKMFPKEQQEWAKEYLKKEADNGQHLSD